MITVMSDMPGKVLGIEASGKVTAADYETILIPAIEEKLMAGKKISLLYYLGPGFSGFGLEAADHSKNGMSHLSAWEKIALVSDNPLVDSFGKFFGFMFSGEVRIFKDAELEDAKVWAADSSAPQHTSWLDNALEKINAVFPLSDGTTGEGSGGEGSSNGFVSREHINTNFPLSGGAD